MEKALQEAMAQANHARYLPGQQKGHYESFFLRANHPEKPLAFWIRYTIFSPENNPGKAIGELWGMFFDGETGRHVAVKDEFPFSECSFSRDTFEVHVGNSKLVPGRLRGKASAGKDSMSWNLQYTGGGDPLFLLPLKFYSTGFPKAKALVGAPLAAFTGIIIVNGQEVEVKEWIGSQNHNWGVKHTDLYAWGQVAGFDNEPDSFLEAATARLKFGPIWTPRFTVLVLRHKGREYVFNSLLQSVRAKGKFDYFSWNFSSQNKEAAISGTIRGQLGDFVGLAYYNPPGGVKHCLNSKIAQAEVRLQTGGQEVVLTTKNRAAFEILTDDKKHGVDIRV